MRIPEKWLRAVVNPPISSEQLSDLLTMAGLEVEDAQALAPDFSGVVVARVLEAAPHPDADRLRVCKVDIGAGGDPLQIVCGAPNVAPGMIVPCATNGAVLPGGFKIKQAKMRGVESQGMLCSAKELGIAEDAEGLLSLPEFLANQLGRNVREALSLDDQVFTLKLTPNRADCLSIAGVAREVAALTGAPMQLPLWPAIASHIQDKLPVRIEARDLCGRFSGRVIRGVNAKAQTPDWMRTRLEQAGQRCISVLVDISNYVMLEMGRPNHIFDLDKVKGGLVVRWAKEGESIELLNGQTIMLRPNVGVIADDQGPESLAGIMGGQATSVSDETQNIYVEAAFWWPDAIRGRARAYHFTTEAGHRFERGVDWATTCEHVDYLTHLIQTICGGQAGPIDDQITELPKRAPVRMRVGRCNRVLGIQVSAQQCCDIFSRLDFKPELTEQSGESVIAVSPPSFRFDIEIEEDLIEEVARVHGFAKIPARPPKAEMVMTARRETQRSVMQLRERLVACDYTEVITYSFIGKEASLRVLNEEPLALLNPMASHQAVMRTSLIPGLLETLATNVARRQSRVRVFEVGRTFHDRPQLAAAEWSVQGIDQPLRIAGLCFGPLVEDQWGHPPRVADFFDVKADLESLAHPASISTRRMEQPIDALHPGRAAEVLLGNKVIGVVGELHPSLVQAMALASAPIVFELTVASLLSLPVPKPSEPSKFPLVSRDLAFVVDQSVPAGAMIARINSLKSQSKQGGWITNFRCFDEYRGKGLAENEKSLAFRFILQNPENTLQDPEVEALMSELVQHMHAEFGARLRA
jgi:phenylalanyl-tRNA synthetase beta chain